MVNVQRRAFWIRARHGQMGNAVRTQVNARQRDNVMRCANADDENAGTRRRWLRAREREEGRDTARHDRMREEKVKDEEEGKRKEGEK